MAAREEIIDGEIVEETDDDNEHRALVVQQHPALARQEELSVDDLVAQVEKVRAAMERAMQVDVHYGRIPGVEKPSLFKPGAEKLCVLFRLAPTFKRLVEREDDHMDVTMTCVLRHIPTGLVVGEGVGFCSSRESRYAYRNANRVCPACGAEAIIKGKAEYGGGWLCWKRRDGCGAKYADGDAAIVGQEAGKIDNPDLPDTYNTILKMAAKRALVAAVLVSTAASDLFTQDVEDMNVGGNDTAQQEEAESQFTAPRTTDGQDTRGRGAPSDAQVGRICGVVKKLIGAKAVTIESALDQIVSHYGATLTPASGEHTQLEATVRTLTGGREGSASKLIDRLDELAKEHGVG